MKKFLALILVALMIFGALVSCGKRGDYNLNETVTDEVTDELLESDEGNGDEQTSNDANTDNGNTDNGNTNNDNTNNTPADHTHTGGTATCTKKAVCTTCNKEYGELAAHTGGTATCKDKAICTVCNTAYGELATNHTGGTATCKDKAICTVCNNQYGELATNHTGGADATCKTESVCTLCNKPYGGLDAGNHEGTIDWVKTEAGHKKAYTCCGAAGNEFATEEAHNYINNVCTVCGYDNTCTQHTGEHNCTKCNAFIKHIYSNNQCTTCGLKLSDATVSVGDIIYFGSYPQSAVSGSMATTLTNKAGTLPTSANPQKWTSYRYYAEGVQSDYMWYIDIEEGNEKYRGVYFTSYRPIDVNQAATEANSQQKNNGYNVNSVYWFKFEPIKWVVLQATAEKALIVCDMIIDSQEYQAADSSINTTNSNRYATSAIRDWLNQVFYETAFDELQRQVILTTVVKNDLTSMGSGYDNPSNPNPFPSDDTNDKIFLLSRGDLKNSEYGFTNPDLSVVDSKRKKAATDYTKCQGVYLDQNGSWWYVRTPYYNTSNTSVSDAVHRVKGDSTLHQTKVYLTTGGVVPAMWIYI